MEKLRLFFEQLRQSAETFLRLLLISKWRRVIRKQNNRRLIVLGNGPSLHSSVESLGDSISNADLMCVNFYPATDDYERLKPAYFITSAPELWRDGVDDFYIDFRLKIFNALAEKTTWPLEVFIAWEAKKFPFWISILSKNPNIKITYYNILPAEGFPFFRQWMFDRQLGMPRPHNVLVPSVMMGMQKGYSDIILLGADHSWLPQISVDNHNNVLVNQKHFYDANSSKPETMKKLGKGQRKLHEVLWKFAHTFESYFIILRYAEDRNVRIINASPDSFIDAFERMGSPELKQFLSGKH